MRVYLTQAVEVAELNADGGAVVVAYPSSGFYANVRDELGEDWIAKGIAFEASPDNKVIAYLGVARELIDFDAGQKLAPEHAARPPAAPVEPEPVEPSAEEV